MSEPENIEELVYESESESDYESDCYREISCKPYSELPDVDYTKIRELIQKMKNVVELYKFKYEISEKWDGYTQMFNISVYPDVYPNEFFAGVAGSYMNLSFTIYCYNFGNEFYVSFYQEDIELDMFNELIDENDSKYLDSVKFDNCINDIFANHIEIAMHVLLTAFKSGINIRALARYV